MLAASMGFSFFSLMIASTGLFFDPLNKAFGWSRTLLSSGASIATVLTAVLSPFFGVLIDRHGSRRIVLPGLLVTMASIAAFSLINGSAAQWFGLWSVFGFVAVSIKSTAWTAAVLKAFERSKGLALGLTLAGAAVAQAIVPPLTNWLIVTMGWRATFVWLAVGWGGLTFLLCFFCLFDRDHKRGGYAGVEGSQAIVDGLERHEALRDSALWRVGISNFVVMAMTMGLTIHLFPILTNAGVSRTNAAWLSSLAGLAGIAGKVITGYLLDRYKANWVGGLTLGAAALAFLLLINGIRSPSLIIVALLVNGYAAGTKTQITGFLTASYGGLRNFGVIYGVMAALMALASGVGPLLGGLSYDYLGGYDAFLALGAAGCLLGGFLMITLPAYPDWALRETDNTGARVPKTSDDKQSLGELEPKPEQG
ncbi:MFS transporter [Sphingobium sufflavum]|uniref:MFS transporter n=1 Tax=Sphingobium sufflavum TaxID=1129547 RepID=UPI001F400BC0|nr:MFS transporter [Sphingobium sufflavum]MCE7798073.1 MFS transporter [Sphingobium sufflavum]